MRHLRLSGLLLFAAGAIAAILATTAHALPTILPETITTGTGKSIGETELVKANGGSIRCKSGRGFEGTVESNHHLGMFHLALEGCTAEGLFTCTGLGDNSGVVLKLGSWHLVYDTLGASLAQDGVAILSLISTVHFECVGKLFIENGMGLCLVLNPTALTKVFEFHCNKAVGAVRPEITKYYNEAGTLVSIRQEEVAENEGTAVDGVIVGLGTVESPEAALIMV
jgi:hypothetical protein